MVKWRIYYGDGSVVDGTSLPEWLAAPDEGVQIVTALYGFDGHGRPLGQVAYGSDWYGFDGLTILQGRASSLKRGVWRECDVANPKRGKWIDFRVWREIKGAGL